MNKAARYVTTWGLSTQISIFSEIMLRNNAGDTTPEQMVQISPSMLGGSWAIHFKGNNQRQGWLVTGRSPSGILAWFADGSEGTVIEQNERYVPNHLRCESSYYMAVRAALEAMENYVLRGDLPTHTMPPAHLMSVEG